jgi:hypothetical protein
VALLEDLHSLIQYNPILREIQHRRSPTKAVTLTKCPARHEALARSLRKDLHRAMAESEPDATSGRRMPAECHTDESPGRPARPRSRPRSRHDRVEAPPRGSGIRPFRWDLTVLPAIPGPPDRPRWR